MYQRGTEKTVEHHLIAARAGLKVLNSSPQRERAVAWAPGAHSSACSDKGTYIRKSVRIQLTKLITTSVNTDVRQTAARPAKIGGFDMMKYVYPREKFIPNYLKATNLQWGNRKGLEMKDREIKAKFWPIGEKTEYRILLCTRVFKHILKF